jgi:DNA-binding transcriptional LysR family regulator
MLDPRLLATFREVAVRGSFSAAADALGFTQPAISQHISRLEKALDMRLLDRDARSVRPTLAGETLLRGADGVLDQLRRLESDVRASAGQARPAVRVGAFQTTAAGLLPGAVSELRSRHPDVLIDLTIVDPSPAVERLAAGMLDVAMMIESPLSPLPAIDGVEYVHVFEDPMMVAVSPNHRLAGRASIELEELAEEPWLLTEIGGTCEDTNIVLRACHETGFMPDIRFQSEDYAALQGMASAGLGIALIPSLATVNARADLVIRPLRGHTPVRHILAAIRTGDRDPVVDAFVDGLISAGAAMSPARRLSVVA